MLVIAASLAHIQLGHASTSDQLKPPPKVKSHHDWTTCIQMKRLIFFALSVSLTSQPVLAQVDSDIHALCIDAKDYSGCVNLNKNSEKILKASKEERDILGEEIIKGWISYEAPAGKSVSYVNPETIKKLMVRSTFGRYFQFSYLQRDYVPPVPAKQGYYGPWKPEETTCEWKSGKRYCTTYPASRNWYPGTPAQQESVKEEESLAIVDCKDRTAKWSKSNRSWRSRLPYFIQASIKDFCYRVESLPESTNSKYASGTPSLEDIEFVNRNRRKYKSKKSKNTDN